MYLTDSKTSKDWEDLKPKLEKSDDELLWRNAYKDFFWDRINSRYLEPISKLRENDSYLGYGFTIMTILCSLVEFIESTHKGAKYRFCRDTELGLNEYNKSKTCFVDFLVTKPPFHSRFSEKIASEFYGAVRCGLLHEASTKEGWRIWGRSESGKEIICYDSRKVYRDDFENAIKEYMKSYSNELVSDNERKKAFIRKFDWLCE